ncbi:MAG: site-specific DNA-methyltransferase [Candidatus Omnitrophica bacterium]|nr:site-specific DNA-methyltransferase [Candidatus Omnitrophota bacterium]
MASADMDRTGGLLVQGDNLKALTFLRSNPSVCGKVQLIYIDPPFGTRQVFTVTNGRTATISRGNGGEVAYLDTLSGKEYLEFLELRLEAMRDLLADTGSIYVHIDCKIGHHVKCLLDDVFGEENFLNDITRIKCNPKNFARKGYGNVKDMILFYRKSDRFVWNDSRQSIEIPPDDKRFRGVDAQGRRYTTTPLHAPGETANGPTGKPWRGLRPPAGRHWRYPPDALEDLDRRGLIEWSSTGNPRKKIYADEVAKNGVKVQDVWTFKDPQNPRYPTEKNLDMLKLIVSNSSRPGDLIMDAFCGSGSTLAAAQELGRRWIGIDASNVAIAASRSRLPGCRFVRLEEGYGAVLA